jgi:hypothetical protein
MPRLPGHPYTCPRCGYAVSKRGTIRRHLYEMKGICSPTVSNIEMTNEIKEIVLQQRIYKPPVQTSLNVINNNQTINNYIANMDVFEKLNHLTQYNHKTIENFEEKVERIYEDTARRFQEDDFRVGNVTYNHSHFLDMIHNITKAKERDLEDFNVVYDQTNKRFCISVSGDWEDFQKDNGLSMLVETLIDYHLEYYEVYIIRKIMNASVLEKHSLEKNITDYYRFLAAFDIKPRIADKTDTDITDNASSSSRTIIDRYTDMYSAIIGSITTKQRREIHKEVLDIVKANTSTNAKDLNKRIMNMLKLDAEFKLLILHE